MTASVFIGMPAYESERFLRLTLDSLLVQTYRNWTLLIADDASTDGTRTIAEEYARRDPRIRYYRHDRNIGQFANFKFLLDRAAGDYFMWAGHDDMWDARYLEACIDLLTRFPDRRLAFAGHDLISRDGTVVLSYPDFPDLAGPRSLWTTLRFILDPEVLGKPNFMYSIFHLPAARVAWSFFPQRKVWGADILFSLAAISHFGVAIDPRVLFHKRLGGYSDPEKARGNAPINLENPKDHIFPVGSGRFWRYLSGHWEALRGTPYQVPGALALLVRLPRALALHAKTRNYQRYLPFAP